MHILVFCIAIFLRIAKRLFRRRQRAPLRDYHLPASPTIDEKISSFESEISEYKRQTQMLKTEIGELTARLTNGKNTISSLEKRIATGVYFLDEHAPLFSEKITESIRSQRSPLQEEYFPYALALYFLLKEQLQQARVISSEKPHASFAAVYRVHQIDVLMDLYALKIETCSRRLADDKFLRDRLVFFWEDRRDTHIEQIKRAM